MNKTEAENLVKKFLVGELGHYATIIAQAGFLDELKAEVEKILADVSGKEIISEPTFDKGPPFLVAIRNPHDGGPGKPWAEYLSVFGTGKYRITITGGDIENDIYITASEFFIEQDRDYTPETSIPIRTVKTTIKLVSGLE